MKSLDLLVGEILADGVIDTAEVKELHDLIFADGTVDKDEMLALCKLNEEATSSCPEFEALYIEAAKNFALEDETTPGVIDEEEGDFLVGLFNNDGEIDAVEVAVIKALFDNAEQVSSVSFTALYDSVK